MPTAGNTTNTGPAYDVDAITPHDTNLIGPYRAIILTAAGAVAMTLMTGDEIVLGNGALSAGMIHPIQFKRIKSTGTTATGIWGVK